VAHPVTLENPVSFAFRFTQQETGNPKPETLFSKQPVKIGMSLMTYREATDGLPTVGDPNLVDGSLVFLCWGSNSIGWGGKLAKYFGTFSNGKPAWRMDTRINFL
jgi:hypothetical protein